MTLSATASYPAVILNANTASPPVELGVATAAPGGSVVFTASGLDREQLFRSDTSDALQLTFTGLDEQLRTVGLGATPQIELVAQKDVSIPFPSFTYPVTARAAGVPDGENGGTNSTIGVALVIDRSGSMNIDKLDDAKAAAVQFVTNLAASPDRKSVV